MKNKLRRKMYIISFLVFVTLLSGCSKEKVDYVSEDFTATSEYETSVGEYIVPDIWEENITNTETGATIRINTSVDVVNADNMKVINIVNKTYDEASKEEFIRSLTDGTVYKYDLEYYTKDMLESIINNLESRIQKLEENGVFADNPELKDELGIILTEYQTLYDNASDSLTVVEDYQGDRYLLKYDDKDYIVSFFEFGEEFLYESYEYSGVSLELVNPYEYTSTSDKEYEEVNISQEKILIDGYYDSVENVSSMTEEEAVVIAEDFIKDMDFGEFVVTDQYHTSVYGTYSDGESYFSDTWHDGYTIRFERTIGGVKFDAKKYHNAGIFMQNQMIDGMAKEGYGADDFYISGGYQSECLLISVNDSGIVRVSYMYPIETQNVMAENIELLSFDKVQAVVENELATNPYFTESFYNIRECELTYFPVRDKDNRELRALIPVWSMITSEENAYVVVNAIDGSVVNVGINMNDVTLLELEE